MKYYIKNLYHENFAYFLPNMSLFETTKGHEFYYLKNNSKRYENYAIMCDMCDQHIARHEYSFYESKCDVNICTNCFKQCYNAAITYYKCKNIEYRYDKLLCYNFPL